MCEPFNAGRADSLYRDTRTECTVAFCEEIKRLGLVPGVYANTHWFKTMLNFSKIQDYSIWCAKWDNNDGKPGKPPVLKYDLWQYTSKGSIEGIKNHVDISLDKSALINGDSSTTQKSLNEVAMDVIDGKYGNGQTRKDTLIKEGYDYDEIQSIVNKLLKHPNLNIGDMVTLKSDAVYYNGDSIPIIKSFGAKSVRSQL